jgi:hypothetical protein
MMTTVAVTKRSKQLYVERLFIALIDKSYD